MTLLAATTMVQSIDQALDAASRAAAGGADLIEFRVDRFAHDPASLSHLVANAALPCIVTCRPTWEGGFYDGGEDARVNLFKNLIQAPKPPAYIDLEWAGYQQSHLWRQQIDQLLRPDGPTGLILSSHDFDGRPSDLSQRVEAMASVAACRVVKVAWRAQSLLDNLEAFKILARTRKPTVAICMGEPGLPSRVLAKKFNAMLTFASLEPTATTAEGQPTIAQLKHLYRWDTINRDTRVLGVIGHPVSHSAGPAVHNAGFNAVGFDAVYLPMPIAPGYDPFAACVSAWLDMPGLHFHGASVTIPHKQNLLRFVRERGGTIEPLAQQIGAANTLARSADGSLHAANTDYAAALDTVCAALNISRAGLAQRRVAVIGAGGAARAVVAGFAASDATVVVYNRTLEKAQELADQFNGKTGKVVPARLDKLCDSCCQIYVNCTPIGMHPHTDATPIPAAPSWEPGTLVFDTIYNPPRTRLLRDAQAAGCVTASGLDMFVRQAAMQFEMWTGHAAPTDLFRRVLTEYLAG